MLFKSYFNWLRYQITPTTYLFKNRLFIEREGRTRRIATNMGLVFRNSKWVINNRINIPQFQISKMYAYWYGAGVLLCGGLVVSPVIYYLVHNNKNLFLQLLWGFSDCGMYYITFSCWLFFIGGSNLGKWVLTYCMGDLIPNTPTGRLILTPPTTNFNPPMIDLELSVSGGWCDILRVLYKNIFFLRLGEYPIWGAIRQTNQIFTNTALIALWQQLCPLTNVKPIFSKSLWNVQELVSELQHVGGVKWTRGLFYWYDLNHTALNNITQMSTFLGINQLLFIQLQLSKQQRWLAKYVHIHCQSFQTLNTIVELKRNFNTTFYRMRWFQTNLWQQFASKSFDNGAQTAAQFSLWYDKLLTTPQLKVLTKNPNTYNMTYRFHQFRYYEMSYLWAIKRVYTTTTHLTNRWRLGYFIYPAAQPTPNIPPNTIQWGSFLFTGRLVVDKFLQQPTITDEVTTGLNVYVSFVDRTLFTAQLLKTGLLLTQTPTTTNYHHFCLDSYEIISSNSSIWNNNDMGYNQLSLNYIFHDNYMDRMVWKRLK